MQLQKKLIDRISLSIAHANMPVTREQLAGRQDKLAWDLFYCAIHL